MVMNQYFSVNADQYESKPRIINAIIGGTPFVFFTDKGVFSVSGVDFGTRLLLETILTFKAENVLDLGSGVGVIGIVLAKLWQTKVTMTEINPRAVQLSRRNAKENRVRPTILHKDAKDVIADGFDLIVTNPPIRAGKEQYYPWFRLAYDHLAPGKALIFVIRKDQGALSAMAHCETFFSNVTILKRKSGYYVIKCEK
jgi:16S rRNA (guanine1207-N2)-methyltransferase